MLNVRLVGDKELIAKLDRMSPSVRAALVVKTRALALRLQRKIQSEKLSGQVLNVRTGALRRSIHQEVIAEGSKIVGKVMSSGDVKYARIHEFGGQTKAHVIEAKNGGMLAFPGAGGGTVFRRRVNHPGSRMPERSFMRSSLREMAPTITREYKEVVIRELLKMKRTR